MFEVQGLKVYNTDTGCIHKQSFELITHRSLKQIINQS